MQLLRPQPGTRVDVENVAALVYFQALAIEFQDVICARVLSVHMLGRPALASDTTYHIGRDLQSVVSRSDW